MRGWGIRTIAALSLLGGCDGAPRETGEKQEPATQKQASVPAPATPAPTVVARPNFGGPVHAETLAALPAAEREKVATSPVPVLVPKDPAWHPKLVITTGPHWFAFSVTQNGVTVSVHATRVAHVHPDMPAKKPDRDLRQTKAFIGQNELIWNASWQERQVAYSLDVECAVTADARCADDKFLIQMAESLVYVGGSPKSAEP